MAIHKKNHEPSLDEILEKEVADVQKAEKVEAKEPEKPAPTVKKATPATGTAKVW